MTSILKGIFYSFPFRLFLLHFRSHLLLLSMWFLLVLLISGGLGRKLGMQFLFLDPEYLGAVNFWSFLLIGLTFGGFYMTWNLTTYLITAHNFPFLASLSRPFTKFCINNVVLPIGFLLFYLGYIMYFQAHIEVHGTGSALLDVVGFLTGMFSLIFLYFLYFRFTNRDISHFEPKMTEALSRIAPGQHDIDVDYIKKDRNRLRVDTYLSESLQPRIVRSVAHYDSDLLMRIFRQNHLNALILQLLGMILLAGLGSLGEFRIFRIPAAGSLLIFLSIITALIGAISYWFAKWKFPVMLLFLIVVNFITSFEPFNYRNPAFGLNYDTVKADYRYENLQALCRPDSMQQDLEATEAILETWAQRVAPADSSKPLMLILAVSGGGLKAATWAMKVVQAADSTLNGQVLPHTVLITGASGGMMGMVYLRELYLRKQQGEIIDLNDPEYVERVSGDLLNSVAFTLVSNDLFLPWSTFSSGKYTYRKDRGYSFEKQFNENIGGVLDKTLGDYREPEKKALIPMCYITPSVINDARRLIISPQDVSFMMAAPTPGLQEPNLEIDAVDFRAMFSDQDADNLRMLTALRMNATYPYILPSIHMPSEPGIEVTDAGFRDNYGLLSATRFIQALRPWILENTRGVALLQISSSNRFEEIPPSDEKGLVEQLFNPFGIPRQLISLQEFEQDNSLSYIYDLLGPDHFHVLRFMFRPEQEETLRATISFHISHRERNNILAAMDEPDNQASLRRLKALLQR